jgi:hypothetical protein
MRFIKDDCPGRPAASHTLSVRFGESFSPGWRTGLVLLDHDSCRHRGMNIAMVAVAAYFCEGKAKGAAWRKRPRVEFSLVSRDGMGDRITVRPGHFRPCLYSERLWTEGKVGDRDAVAGAGRGCGGSGSWRCRRRISRSAAWGTRGRSGGCAATGRQQQKQAENEQGQADTCDRMCSSLLHFFSSSTIESLIGWEQCSHCQ